MGPLLIKLSYEPEIQAVRALLEGGGQSQYDPCTEDDISLFVKGRWIQTL